SFYVIQGGCSFGILAPLVKLGYTYGISTSDSVRLQFMVGVMLLGLITILFVKYRMSLKTFVKVLLSGTPTDFTTSFYYNTLAYLDASIAIVVLFQYTWMGLIVDMFLDKQAPTKEKLGAIVLLFVGSILAVNIYDINLNHLPPRGIMWGLLEIGRASCRERGEMWVVGG